MGFICVSCFGCLGSPRATRLQKDEIVALKVTDKAQFDVCCDVFELVLLTGL